MPRNKDLKRLVRTRMQKTGEAYTTARAHITKKRKPKKPTSRPVAVVSPAPKTNYAELAGMSDATIKEKTGCTWERWVIALDYAGAADMSHGEIATFVNEKYNVDGWWSQAVTVGYERIKGLRARGQRLDGSYEASKSRTFNVPVEALFAAWDDAAKRKRWLNEPGIKVRTSTAPKSMRLGWSDGTIAAVWFTGKGKTKSSVALAHTKLPDRETAERLRQYWSERLDALREVLNP
jgi:hypothetical protein